MFDPLTPTDLLSGLAAVMRAAARPPAPADGPVRAQVLSGASVARLTAVEVGAGTRVRADLDTALLRVLEPVGPSDGTGPVLAAAAAVAAALRAGDRQQADAALVALTRATRTTTDADDRALGSAVRAALRAGIESETTAYSEESAR